tara:strand:+ start:597 stop:1970 length:1374 start_codon:yes stop_codon:yes gene_type:complete
MDSVNSKTVPHSLDAEKAVLGCILIDNNSLSSVLEYLSVDSFYDANHRIIFDAMLSLYDNNLPIDSVNLSNQLKKTKDLDKVGGAYYITGLSQEAPSVSNSEQYSKIVREKQILRTIIETSVEMNQLAYDDHDEISEIVDKAEQHLFGISELTNKKKYQDLEPMLRKVLEVWGDRKKGDITGVPSGFQDLDNQISGFQKSDLIVLAARPSMGKTALALNLARNAAINNNMKIGFFSLEMSTQQLTERLLSSEAEISSHLVRIGKLPKRDWRKLSDAASTLSEANIYIDDSPGLNIMELRAKARQMKLDKDVDLILVDYLQLLHKQGKVESRQQEISYISRSLKALAKELDVPIIALSQLSRAPESRSDHRPIMSDLRESGAIEQDADIVLFIFRKFVYSKDEEDKGIAELIVSKHRNGPTGVIKLSFIDDYAKFENYDFIHSGDFNQDEDLSDAVFE